jgi:hypothetical protein
MIALDFIDNQPQSDGAGTGELGLLRRKRSRTRRGAKRHAGQSIQELPRSTERRDLHTGRQALLRPDEKELESFLF